GRTAPADGTGRLADAPRSPADGAGVGEPGVAVALRPRAGRDGERLRRPRVAAEPPGVAGLAGERADVAVLVHQTPAPADRGLGALPPVVAPARRERGEGPG